MLNLNKYFIQKKKTKNFLKTLFNKPIFYKNREFTLETKKKYNKLKLKNGILPYWRYASYDVYPPLPPKVVIFKSNQKTFALGLKIKNKEEILGEISLNDKDIGVMKYLDVNGKLRHSTGNYYILTDKHIELSNKNIQSKNIFLEKINKVFNQKQIELFEKVTKKKFEVLVKKLNVLSDKQISEINSNIRWINTPLNKFGLHVLRSMLADNIYKKKIFKRKSLPESFLKKGYVKLPFTQKKKFLKILKIISPNQKNQKRIIWRKSIVKYLKKDEQTIFHIDSFHNTFKVWVYPAKINKKLGPLEIISNSHINTKTKLEWLYYISNTKNGIKEPSFRLSKKWQKKFGNTETLLPIKNKKTIIIVNTYLFHKRGKIQKNLKRITYRLAGDNDGGLKRINPFL